MARLPLGAVLLGAAVLGACLLAGCGGRAAAPKAPPEFPFPASAPASFVLRAEGFSALPEGESAGGNAAGSKAEVPLPLALRVAALSADAAGTMAVAAVNRFGLGIVELSPDGQAWKLLNFGLPETRPRSVAGLWPRNGGFLLELDRDPFVEGGPAPSDIAPELLAIDLSWNSVRLGRLGEPGEDLFALFAAPGGKWYAELRREKPLGATLRYLELAAPESAAGAKTMTRELFETSLAPRPLSLGPASLRNVLGALGPGPWLVQTRNADGSEAFWISGGKPEDAKSAFAWVARGEEEAVALTPDGEAAALVAGAASATAFKLAAPASDARFTGLALLSRQGTRGILLASWDTGMPPEVRSSGLCVSPIP